MDFGSLGHIIQKILTRNAEMSSHKRQYKLEAATECVCELFEEMSSEALPVYTKIPAGGDVATRSSSLPILHPSSPDNL